MSSKRAENESNSMPVTAESKGESDPLYTTGQSVTAAYTAGEIDKQFLIKVAREVDAVMQREMFTPPGGPTYIPPEYIVYLSNGDDKDWQDEKRHWLEKNIYNLLLERARELAGNTQLVTKSFAIKLRVDSTLNKGEFRAQPVWDGASD